MNKSAAEWCELTGIVVQDPDGWDRGDPNFYENWENKKICFDEFWNRAMNSTTGPGCRSRSEIWNNILDRLIAGEIHND